MNDACTWPVRAAIVVLALTTAVPVVASLQPATQLIREPCADCAMHVRALYTTDDPAGAISDLPYDVHEIAGSFLVIAARMPLQLVPAVFGVDGRFRRNLGTSGNGPGEIALPIWSAPLAADTVRIFQPGRMTDFLVDGTFVRASAQVGGLAFVHQLHLFPTGVAAIIPAGIDDAPTALDRRPVRLRSATGELGPPVPLPSTRGEVPTRILGRAHRHAAGEFWVAQQDGPGGRGYTLTRVSSRDGAVLQTLRHEPRWWLSFPLVAQARGGFSSTGPSTSIRHVWERTDGVLLVLMSHAHPDWRQIQQRAGVARTARFEVRVVAIDLAARTVLGTATTSGSPLRLVSDSRFAVYSTTADGEPQVTVYELRVR
jgi:hypothetical protein